MQLDREPRPRIPAGVRKPWQFRSDAAAMRPDFAASCRTACARRPAGPAQSSARMAQPNHKPFGEVPLDRRGVRKWTLSGETELLESMLDDDRVIPAKAMLPSIDVVVPCYNYARFLRAAVSSALADDLRVRVLIIDDASPDDTEAVGRSLAEQDPRVTYLRHSANRGHIRTYNEGIEWAESDLFVLLSADDMLMPGSLARSAAAMAAHTEMGMVFGRGLWFEDGLPEEAVLSGGISVTRFMERDAFATVSGSGVAASKMEAGGERDVEVLNAAAFFDLNRSGNVVPTCGVATRTALQKKLGGYRPELPHSGDLEMWLRFATYADVGYVPRFQVAVRHHGVNMWRQHVNERDLLQRIECIASIGESHGPRLPASSYAAMRQRAAEFAVRDMWRSMLAGNEKAASDLWHAAPRADPGIRRRLIWHSYGVRRWIGPKMWESARTMRDRLLRLRDGAVASPPE